MIQKQKYLKDKGMLALLVLISAFPPLSTDLYLPALPQMKKILDTSQSQVNLTLSMSHEQSRNASCFTPPQ